MLIHFRPDVNALRPKVVVILAGTNDIAGDTGPSRQRKTTWPRMAKLARANVIRVVLPTMLPVSNYPRDGDRKPMDMRIKRPPEKILELNAWRKRYASEKGISISTTFPQRSMTRAFSRET